jgi:probable rRNA maturation factor
MIVVRFHTSVRLPKGIEPAIRRTIKKSLKVIPANVRRKKMGRAKKHLLHVSILTAPEMKRLNKAYRKKNRPTDVLTFSRLEGLPMPAPDIGDLLLCWKVAIAQSKEYGCTIKEEIARLTAHGMLHLFGYDHEKSPREAKIMFHLQSKILNK